MSSGAANFFLKKTLGEDFLESLSKVELWKPSTRSTTDLQDIHLGLKLVPRTMMSFLIRELGPMKDGEHKDIDLPVEGNCKLRVDKHGPDVFSGDLECDNKKITEFKFRPIPGVGLVVMSNLQLYNPEELEEKPKKEHAPEVLDQVQKLIDERLALHDLVGKVVDKKIQERDAIQQLVLAKLSENIKIKDKIVEITKISEESTPNPIEYHRGMTNGLKVAKSIVTGKEPEFLEPTKKIKKSSPLNKFLEERSKKLKKKEHQISLSKGEQVSCPDCGQDIFNSKAFSGCLCFGEDADKKIYIKKSEDGVRIRFGRGWDPENIELLLEVLRSKRG